MGRLTISGEVVTGVGEAGAFTEIPWARNQFVDKLGIDPYPGTLNLILHLPAALETWARLKRQSDYVVEAPDPGWCNALCYPVRVADRFPGAIVFPEIPDYPETQVEIICALPLREKLSLKDGDTLSLEINQPLSVRAVIFDVDGTLVDSVEAYRVVAEQAAAPFGIPVTTEVVRHALNIGHPGFWELVIPEDQPHRVEMVDAIKKEVARQWPAVLRQYGRVFPDVRKMLEVLQNRGIRLGIVTGAHEDSLSPLREDGLLDFFEAIITAEAVKNGKPDPEGLHKIMLAMNVEPGETVYVGDACVDIQASQAAGVASVAVLSGAGDPALLSAAGADRLIHSLLNLSEILQRSRPKK